MARGPETDRRGDRRWLALPVLAAAIALIAAAVAVAALPKVATGGVKSVTDRSAILTGTVDPNGEPTTYHFEYGPGKPYQLGPAAYPSRTPDQGPTAASKGNISVSAAISGLAAGTTYHYRLVAVNGSGTKAGGDKSFKTKAGPAGSIALGASPRTIRFRRTTHLAGQLSPARAGVKVTLQEAPPPFAAKGFKAVATTRTDANGRFAFSRSPIHNRAYRVVADTRPKTTSAAVVVGVRSRVTIARTRRSGRVAIFGGAVGPRRDGESVRIQRRVRGHWRTVKRGVLGPAGDPQFSSFRVRVRVKRTGVYRAYVSPNAENLAGASRRRTVHVR